MEVSFIVGFGKNDIKAVTKKEGRIITAIDIIAPVKCQPCYFSPYLKLKFHHSEKPLNKIIKKRIELIAPAQEEVNGRLSQIFML